MEYIFSYLAVVFIIQAIGAFRTPYENTQTVFFASMCWPLMIVLIAGSFALDAIRWDFDVARSSKMFGYRKPTNLEVRGFAVTAFTVEFQFYSTKKA